MPRTVFDLVETISYITKHQKNGYVGKIVKDKTCSFAISYIVIHFYREHTSVRCHSNQYHRHRILELFFIETFMEPSSDIT